VLKDEASTLRQGHNFISIDFNFGVGDYVRAVTCPAKFGSDPMSGRDATWGNIYGSCDFKYSPTELQPILVRRFSRSTAQTDVRKILFGIINV